MTDQIVSDAARAVAEIMAARDPDVEAAASAVFAAIGSLLEGPAQCVCQFYADRLQEIRDASAVGSDAWVIAGSALAAAHADAVEAGQVSIRRKR